ncbi:HrpJ domain-containing protein [Pseudomonas sp. R3-52-08]|uniref:HrpJ domain-containing protein n=1 Tax=Pseudomonas sp. R3-52-08 TaxID=1173284 RepID=UPI000F562271|nr:HrpJ domain-containing protein [Pseudomonas sp. R3-52-08]AZF19473.1 type III secretion protein HrpJ [Pseudomonas sp. R3-52-08]
MKVESFNDVQQIQPADKPSVSTVDVPIRSQGLDDIAQIFSEEVALNAQALGRRSIGTKVSPVAEFVQLYEQLGHPGLATLETVVRRLRFELLRKPTVEKLVSHAGGDPARAFVVLQFIALEAQNNGLTVEEGLARGALKALRQDFGGHIQAGLNIALALKEASADPQERQDVRALYYASVVVRQSLALMLQTLLKMYGLTAFSKGVDLMTQALNGDIAAHTQSVPTEKLHLLLKGLAQCRQLRSVLGNCDALIRRLNVDLEAVDLLQRFLGYASTGIDAAEVQRLASEFGGTLLAARLRSLNELATEVKSLPKAWWLDAQSQASAVKVFKDVMVEWAREERGHQTFSGETRTSG